MSVIATPLPRVRRNYLNINYTAKSWLLTLDHKRIGILYMVSVSFFFSVGGLAATLIRINLLTPEGNLVSNDTYNKLFTIHGITMVWFFLLPSIPTVLGNFLLPLMIGARDLAFPRLNLASWYVFVAGGAFTLYTLISGGVDTGWTFYTPFSTNYAQTNVMLALIGISIVGFSSMFTAINFIVTTHKMRAPGLTWFRLPLFVWSMYAASLIMVLGTPVVAIAILLVGLER